MRPGMRMLMLDKMRDTPKEEHPRSEYAGSADRRMIGYDRNGERDRPGMAYTGMPYHEPRGFPPMSMDEREGPEARRRRDSRGRYAAKYPRMDDDWDDDDDEPKGYSPRARRGNSYGDIYAHGTVYAPGAMNKPSGGQAGGMTSSFTGPVDEHTAKRWVQKMSGGEHFKPEQAEQMRTTHCPDCEKWEFYVVVNMLYSDYGEVAKKLNMDRADYYANMAKAFLEDQDAAPHKLQRYMEAIPR